MTVSTSPWKWHQHNLAQLHLELEKSLNVLEKARIIEVVFSGDFHHWGFKIGQNDRVESTNQVNKSPHNSQLAASVVLNVIYIMNILSHRATRHTPTPIMLPHSDSYKFPPPSSSQDCAAPLCMSVHPSGVWYLEQQKTHTMVFRATSKLMLWFLRLQVNSF